MIAGLLVWSFVLALAGARGLLGVILHLMTAPGFGVTFYWRPVVFAVALFWFWYLAPAVVESRTLARVILLFGN